MRWDSREIKALARNDYEKAWMRTIDLVAKQGEFRTRKEGKELRVYGLMQKIRATLIKNGFNEVSLPVFVDETDVYAQHGPEAPIALERCYYLASLPRPAVTITDEKAAEIKRIAPSMDEKKIRKLQSLFHEYKKGSVESDALIEEMVTRLGVRMEQATAIIELFPQFKEMKPSPTTTTLRSHMTSAWFETLAALSCREPFPIMAFTFGLEFRNEQVVDATHLRAHYDASCVIMDENVSLEDGQSLVKKLLGELGFADIKFKKKKATSKCYIPGTEYKVLTRTSSGQSTEIAGMGLYSPIALSNYGLEVPVFNMDFGIERMIMTLDGEADARPVLYPQFYGNWVLDDKKISGLVHVEERPATPLGREVSNKIIKTCELYGMQPSPCEFKVLEKEVGDNKLEVWVAASEPSTTLCGQAHLNELYVSDGNIIAIPPSGSEDKPLVREVKQHGTKTGIRFLNAFADYCAARIEREPDKEEEFIVKNVVSGADVNVNIPAIVQRYAKSKNKSISIKGPLFMTVRTRVKRMWRHEQPR